ncbi:protein of unknown function DUF2612 [Vibrio phage 1.123.O._10N.286.48.F3]|nr:protein of unknown function DUF2612 [Vibrio phage 1.123.O._10N.286.48.F3]
MTLIPDFRKDTVISLRLSQMYDSPNYTAILLAIAQAYDDQDAVLNYLGTLSLDSAQGVWLDLFGAIIGQGRNVTTKLPLEYSYFGFINIDPTAGGFGSLLATQASAPSQTNRLPDPDYRRVLIAKAAQNAGDTTLYGIASSLVNVLEDDSVQVYSKPGAEVGILLSNLPDANMLQLIDAGYILPLSSGVVLGDIIYADPTNTFGFYNINSSAAGFGGKLPEVIN